MKRRLVFATALLWWFSGAFQVFPLGWVALTPFFLGLDGKDKRERFRFGYSAGFFSFWLINWWLVPTITKGAPAIGASILVGFPLSLLAVTLIAAVHALQPALVALLWQKEGYWRPLAVALAWAAGDYVRTVSPLAHEWGALAFSQTTDLPFLQLASVTGQHGLTFICAFAASCLALWWKERRQVYWVAPVLLMVLVHAWGFAKLQTSSSGKSLRVLVVQTAVSSLSKNGLGTGEIASIQAFRLTAEALEKKRSRPFDLVIWPETTISLQRFRDMYRGLDWEIWRREGAKIPLLTGASVVDEKNRAWNEAMLIEPEGKFQSRSKSRLVPFGERAPFVEYLPFLQIFAPPTMLEPGGRIKTFNLGEKATLDTQICFESCFPQKVPGQFLVMLTNDEWFAGTEAPRQHRAMGIMRAVENGIPLVQSANGGYSFVVDFHGRIQVASTFGLPQTLEAEIWVPK